MITLKVVALIGLVFGLFTLLGITLKDFTGGIFNGLIAGPKGIREEILEETKTRRPSLFMVTLSHLQTSKNIWKIMASRL